jgi:hypothetical protein
MITSATCIDGSGDGTNRTMPLHIWLHSVILTAIRHGATNEGAESARQKAVFYYTAGEPVWMAAQSVLELARGFERARRENADGFAQVRSAHRASLRLVKEAK